MAGSREAWTVAPPRPAADYAEALALLERIEALDGPDINPVCRTSALLHGAMTDRAIVLIHGMTNCPYQYRQLAPLFFEQGYNVLLARQPCDGLRDRDTRALARLTPAEAANYGNGVVDIARGLGRHVTVAGLSAGGTIAAWLAQTRADVDAAAPIAPLFGLLPNLPTLNTAANDLVSGLFETLPNIMTQRVNGAKRIPSQSYYGFATRGLAAAMRLGREVAGAARKGPPAAGRIVLILNAADPAVNNKLSLDVLRAWQAHGARASLYTFPRKLGLIHDIIDPQQPKQQIDIIYPALLEQITAL